MKTRIHRYSTAARRRGFTLIELLVAATITMLIAGFIAVIVRNVSTTWSRAGGRLGTDAQARLVLDQLQLDLQGALYRDDGNVWMAADVLDRFTNSGLWTEAVRNPKPSGGGANGSLALGAASIADARFGKAGVWLRFLTQARGANDPGNPATTSAPVAVGYQIIRRFAAVNPANRDNLAYLLHRAEVRPATTNNRPGVLEAGYNIVAGDYVKDSNGNSGAVTGDPRGIQIPGTNQGSAGRNLDAVIADNVIDFGIRCYVRDASRPGGLRLIFPVNANGQPGGNGNSRYRATLPPEAPPEQWAAALPFPDVVDVMVRILTDEGAALIASTERAQTPPLAVPQKYNSNAAQWWWGVAQENSRVYTRRIAIQAKPL